MTQQKYAAGTVIAKAGGAIPTLHIVHKGTVSKGDPKAKDGPTLGEGEYFGEAALVGHAQARTPPARPLPRRGHCPAAHCPAAQCPPRPLPRPP
eukprot:3396566-Prymnesium_polylepis.1